MRTERPRRDLIVVLVSLAALNILTVAVLDDAVAAAVQVAVAAGAIVVAVRHGYTVEDLALSKRSMGAGLRLGAALSAIVVAGVVAIALIPATRTFLDDDRFLDISRWSVVYEVFVRIPIVTAMSEELLFRSVLLAVVSAITTRRRSIVASSLCFGLWHVLVTVEDLGGNAATDSLTTTGRVVSVIGVVAATSIAGAIFAAIRLRSASIAAPWLLHTTLNGATFVAGYALAST